jgi:hypothetical protein
MSRSSLYNVSGKKDTRSSGWKVKGTQAKMLRASQPWFSDLLALWLRALLTEAKNHPTSGEEEYARTAYCGCV